MVEPDEHDCVFLGGFLDGHDLIPRIIVLQCEF